MQDIVTIFATLGTATGNGTHHIVGIKQPGQRLGTIGIIPKYIMKQRARRFGTILTGALRTWLWALALAARLAVPVDS